ncbi:hypothetical protein DLAC_01159 [Tieghemostelium lacteum]|uniref:RING-type domain-containing protein n=1 Tax=Tieghemostelium lacteum TaxID=361077 RepID=A0A152A7Z6_TIELA|nr:hypothetical protein DLAC_01159 [Tieghemostelium lacteum]|eukprot:KYR02328.1 hypothetical protein DLAC_01159 [Tieghemostelium lacteum]
MEVSIRITPNSDDEESNNNLNNSGNILNNSSNNTLTNNSVGHNSLNANNSTSGIYSSLTNDSISSNTSTNSINNTFGLFTNNSFVQNTLNSRFPNPFSQLYNNHTLTYSNSSNNLLNQSNGISRTNSENNMLDPEAIQINPPTTTTTTTTTTTNNINNQDQAGIGGGGTTTTDNIITSSSSTRIDIPMLLKWGEQNFAFMVILFIVFLYLHRQGILVFIWQQLVFIQANNSLKNQVALQEKRNIGVLLWLIVILSSNIFTTYLFFSSYELWKSLVFMLPTIEIDVWTAFWIAIVNDFICRFLAMIVKAVVIMVVGHKPPFKRRSQLYTVIEVVSHLYRSILPIAVWTAYLHSLHKGGEHIFGSLMVGLYLTFKLTTLIEKAKQCVSTLRAYILREVLYGKKATSEQIMGAGDLCAICQEKMISPIVLRCNHLFCEDCVSQWFEREKTCPLCRTAINFAGNRTHSDGTTSLLLQLF